MAEEDVLEQPSAEGDEERAEPSLEEKLKEAIDVRVEDVGTLRRKLTVTIPREAIDEQLNKQYDDLRREALVPGFRKGRAPRRLLEKRFGGDVGETLVQQFLTNGYVAATEKTELKVLGDPLIWATEKGASGESLMEASKALDCMEIPKEGPFTFACEVEVRPEFELPALDDIPVTRPIIAITDEKVDAQMDRLRGIAAVVVSGGEGPVQADDLLTVDVKMTSGETVLKEETGVRMAARPQVVDGVVLEKLGEALAGAMVGQTRTISGQIPDTYIKAEFRGKDADFAITVRQIQRQQLPDLNDGLAKHFGFEDLGELREWVCKDMESRLGEEVRQHMADQVCQYLLDKTAFELPERLSERQINHVTMRRRIELYQQGVPQTEVEKILDELKTRAREEAVTAMKLAFVFEKLAETFDVEVEEEEVNAQIAAMARRQGRRFDRVRDDLIKRDALDKVYLRIRDDKIVARLLEQAKVTEEEAPSQPAAEAADMETKPGGQAKRAEAKEPEST